MSRTLSMRLAAVAAAVLAVVGATGVAMTARASSVPPDQSATKVLVGQEEPQAGGWIGIAIADLNEKLAQRLGLTQTSGVVILKVVKDGPAQGKLNEKDIIIKIKVGQNPQTDVTTVKGVHQALSNVKPGDTVLLTVLREGQTAGIEVSVTAGQRPPRPEPPHGKGPRPGLAGPGLLGMLPFHLKELEGIPPAEMFSHFRGAQFTVTDKDGNPVTVNVAAGTVTQAGSGSLTVQLNGASSGTTYTVTADTMVRGKGGKVENLVAGDKVMVITVGSSTTARDIVVMPQPRPREGAGPGRPQSFRPNFDFEHPKFGEFTPGLRERMQQEFGRRGTAVPASAGGL